MTTYYNEFEPKAAAALRQLIKDGLIPQGDVDERSITEVDPDELRRYTQCHFFAGIGGWSRALALAGWREDRPVWTGSCPCQPFSSAGRQRGMQDERHLWPVWFNLIRECRPPVVFGEQVASAIGHGWLDGVFADMEGEGYACGAAVLPACSVDAPHKRDRAWFVANTSSTRSLPGSHAGVHSGEEGTGPWDVEPERLGGGALGHTVDQGPQGQRGDDCRESGRQEAGRPASEAGFWSGAEWIICADGKARRIPSTQSGICLLAYGFPERVGLLRAGGNAIVPEVAARFIQAYDESGPVRLMSDLTTDMDIFA